ncbi:DUF6058 family natural product biosynthesis protein [Streptomyces roseolus]|uniref:DUF6058 family natural product biosynthesis protein n=1 Tax=Streptomyces roseolus TaxID=67358 RepID=UPI001677C031|nr:DUF6058 family natural product biosynthesis protein [Streptomyces roseolus]GGR40233.1 hypothetical protein GCM10010282_36240 [Streptomyces roseolus]
MPESAPDAGTPAPAERLHALVDELDSTEPEFAACDRLRFGGPASGATRVDAARARHPRVGAASLAR